MARKTRADASLTPGVVEPGLSIPDAIRSCAVNPTRSRDERVQEIARWAMGLDKPVVATYFAQLLVDSSEEAQDIMTALNILSEANHKQYLALSEVRASRVKGANAAKVARAAKKSQVFRLWMKWQRGEATYSNQAMFAREAASVAGLKDPKNVEAWCRQWREQALDKLFRGGG